MTVSRQTSTQTGFSYSARVQRDSGNTSTQGIYFYQDFETINSIRFSGGNVSLSFYAKLGANYSSASSILNYTITYGTGTDQSFYSGMTGQANAAGSTVTLTSTFQRFTVTAAIPSSATQISIGFFYTPVGTASTNDWFEITGVQLGVGSVATPFEFEDYGTTLSKCQRYYESGQSASFYQMVVNGTWVPWTERLVHYKVPKRSTGAVSVTVTGSDNAAAGNGTVPSSNVDSFTHRQTVNNGSFPYCAYSLVYTVNSEL
jgi:hypothetical protein